MRAIWTGNIAFGLVNVPVKAYSAVEDHDVRLHQVHNKDGGRIRYQRKCEVCGKVVKYEDIDKAYDDGDTTVVLTEDDLKTVPAERSQEIEILQFVPSEQIEPIMFESSYYLEPDSKSAKAYILLRRTLQNTQRTAIVKFTLRQKTRLGALRVRDAALVLQSLLWADEVREPDFPAINAKVQISDNELTMASTLVEQFSSDFTPEEFEDEYQRELRLLIEEKIRNGEVTSTEETFGRPAEEQPSADAEVIDLMAALKRSVEQRRDQASAKKAGGSR
ncbi:MAG: Ku protein [Propionicimonas sp.]|uniref:non-homologous end joining protein Ku n=1 Tax=Propionicimonas sp. TaxID=1955623 RepID=UPI002B2077F1|nr:Ku protein [Propionicimonas sp.]MEA4944871.1 Ku protein [Propionicimonas sp.]